MCLGILPYVILSSWIILQNTFHISVTFHFIQLVHSSVLFCTDCFRIFILSISQSDGDVAMFITYA